MKNLVVLNREQLEGIKHLSNGYDKIREGLVMLYEGYSIDNIEDFLIPMQLGYPLEKDCDTLLSELYDFKSKLDCILEEVEKQPYIKTIDIDAVKNNPLFKP